MDPFSPENFGGRKEVDGLPPIFDWTGWSQGIPESEMPSDPDPNLNTVKSLLGCTTPQAETLINLEPELSYAVHECPVSAERKRTIDAVGDRVAPDIAWNPHQPSPARIDHHDDVGAGIPPVAVHHAYDSRHPL